LKYSVPNAPDALYLDQAEPDDFDYQALGNRRTGIFSGGNVTALGTPTTSVRVAAGVAIIADDPIRFAAGNVAVAPGGGNPRFDIIAVARDGSLTNKTGASSANALFADFDFDNFAPLAAIYIPQGSTSVLDSHISQKSTAMPNRFSRSYAHASTTFLQSEVVGATPLSYRVNAEGEHYWSNSSLKRLTTQVMQFLTNLVMKTTDITYDKPLLSLVSTFENPSEQILLQAEGSGGGMRAYINGAGMLYADNFKYGNGNPNGVVVGDKGDLYIDRAQGGSSLGIWQKGGANNTKINWVSFRAFAESESALPTGTLIYSLSPTAPEGFIPANGQWISTQGATRDLAAMIGSKYGARSGEIQMPNLLGRTLANHGSGDSPAFTEKGVDSIRLTEKHMPVHDHKINDPGHEHRQAGPYAYVMPWQFHNNRHPVPSDSALEHIYTESSDFDRSAKTGIRVLPAGEGEPLSMYQPTHFVYVYVKL
jgi:microcystin-dependent protein